MVVQNYTILIGNAENAPVQRTTAVVPITRFTGKHSNEEIGERPTPPPPLPKNQS